MVAVPAAAVLINNDLVPSVLDFIVKQLHIDIVQDGETFAETIALDGYFIDNVRRANKRLLVYRDARETLQQELFDVVLFFKNGLVSVQQSNLGPPGATFIVPKLHWGQLCVFETSIGHVATQVFFTADGCAQSSDLFKNFTGTWECSGDICLPVDQSLTKTLCKTCGFPYRSTFTNTKNCKCGC